MRRRATIAALVFVIAMLAPTAYAHRAGPPVRSKRPPDAHTAITANVYKYWYRPNVELRYQTEIYHYEGHLNVCPATHTWGYGNCSRGTFKTSNHTRKKGKRKIKFKETVFIESAHEDSYLVGIVIPEGKGWRNGRAVYEGHETGQWYAKKV